MTELDKIINKMCECGFYVTEDDRIRHDVYGVFPDWLTAIMSCIETAVG